MRIVTGHRFRASDLDLLSKLMANGDDVRFNGGFIRDSKVRMLKDIVENHKLEIKNSETMSSLSDLYSSFRLSSRSPNNSQY